MTQRQRHTRPERERLEMAITVTRTGVASVTAALIKLALFASASGAATMATTGDWRQMLRAAGYVALVALLLFGLLAFLAVLAWLGTRGERAEAEDDWPGVQTGPRTINMLPAVYDERGREVDRWTRLEYDEYMTAVLDDDDETGFNQRDAASFGHDRDKFNALVEWVHARGWYRFSNGVDNRHGGDFIAPHETILTPAPNDANA